MHLGRDLHPTLRRALGARDMAHGVTQRPTSRAQATSFTPSTPRAAGVRTPGGRRPQRDHPGPIGSPAVSAVNDALDPGQAVVHLPRLRATSSPPVQRVRSFRLPHCDRHPTHGEASKAVGHGPPARGVINCGVGISVGHVESSEPVPPGEAPGQRGVRWSGYGFRTQDYPTTRE